MTTAPWRPGSAWIYTAVKLTSYGGRDVTEDGADFLGTGIGHRVREENGLACAGLECILPAQDLARLSLSLNGQGPVVSEGAISYNSEVPV